MKGERDVFVTSTAETKNYELSFHCEVHRAKVLTWYLSLSSSVLGFGGR